MDLIVATLFLCGSAICRAEESAEQRTSVNLALYVVYDESFNHQINHSQKFHQLNKKGPEDYFPALLKAVELRFLDLKVYDIKLTLIKVELSEDWGEPTNSTYSNALDGTETMKQLQKHLERHRDKYNEATIVAFVTGKEVITNVGKDGQWLGLATRGELCHKGVILVSDNGKTFTGTENMALQVALLLNASRDGVENKCNKSDDFLLSSVHGGSHPMLSECSQENIITFLNETRGKCWNYAAEDLDNGMLPASYHNITGYDICTLGYSVNRDIQTCPDEYGVPKRNETCRVKCCNYERGHTFSFHQPAADGTPCGEGSMCVQSQCVNTTTRSYSP